MATVAWLATTSRVVVCASPAAREAPVGVDPEVLHASFVGFYNRVIPFLWSRLLGDIPRRENPFVKARKLDEIINSRVTTFRYSRPDVIFRRLPSTGPRCTRRESSSPRTSLLQYKHHYTRHLKTG